MKTRKTISCRKNRRVSSGNKKSVQVLTLFFSMAVTSLPLISPAQTGVYTLNGGTATQTGQTYAATQTDESAVYVLNGGQLTLTNCTMTKTGDASNVNNSSQYGINAGVLANTAGVVTIIGGSVTTSASGANGLFATGTGSSISMSDGIITVSGASAHGVDATYGGTIILTNVNVTTDGSNASVIATDFGGGTVTVTGGTFKSTATATGAHSAGIYSTGVISVTGASVTSMGDNGGMIDGANSILLTNTDLTGALNGIKMWKTAPASGSSMVSVTGGSVTANDGDVFYITGETGNEATASITVSGGATLNASTGTLVSVISSSTGSFTADGVALEGNFYADETSILSVTLQNSTALTGSAQNTGITIDAGSTWTVTANSVMTSVVDPDGISGLNVTNITGNGYNVHYDSTLAANSYLGGLTYSLVNGGFLTPGDVMGGEEYPANQSVSGILYQSYPNPATRTAIIRFNLPGRSSVKLALYNPSGTEVAILAEGVTEAGMHEVTVDVSGLADGFYYYRLSTDEHVLARKMVVRK